MNGLDAAVHYVLDMGAPVMMPILMTLLGLRVRQRDGPALARQSRRRAALARDGGHLERRAHVTGREELTRERPHDRLRRRGGQPREAQNHERESTRGGDRLRWIA